MSSIIDCKLKFNYILHLNALNIIDDILINGYQYNEKIDNEYKLIIKQIFNFSQHRNRYNLYINNHDQDQKIDEEYVNNSYLQNLLNDFFSKKTRLKIDFKTIENKKFLSNLIMNKDKTMIDLNKIIEIFPNINSMRLIHTKLSIKLFESILNYISSSFLLSKVRRITIYKAIQNKAISAEKLIKKLSFKFKKIDWKCYYVQNEHKIIMAKDQDHIIYNNNYNNSINNNMTMNNLSLFNCFNCADPNESKSESKSKKHTKTLSMTDILLSYYNKNITKIKSID